MSTRQPRTGRVSGHLKLIERKSGPIWYVKTRVPGRTPEQTTTFLAAAHVSGGKPPAGHLTRRQAQDALADILTEERHKVGQRAYDDLGATFADAPPPDTCITSSMSAAASAPPSATIADR